MGAKELDASPEDILRRDPAQKARSAANAERSVWGEQLAQVTLRYCDAVTEYSKSTCSFFRCSADLPLPSLASSLPLPCWLCGWVGGWVVGSQAKPRRAFRLNGISTRSRFLRSPLINPDPNRSVTALPPVPAQGCMTPSRASQTYKAQRCQR